MELLIGMESYEVHHPITKPNWKELDTWRHAHFGKFLTGDETSKYILTVTDYNITGTSTAGDSFTLHNGNKFSTKDIDNDGSTGTNCAEKSQGWMVVPHVSRFQSQREVLQ